MENKKTIVVAGGGFGGLNAAISLAQKLGERARIILADRKNYHLYHPVIYELATAEEEFTSLSDLRQSAVVRFRDIRGYENIDFFQGEVKEIDQHKKTMKIGSTVIPFDYLVCALGSVTDFYKIEGLEQHAYTLKSLTDAFKIRNQLEFLVESHRMDFNKKLLRVVIGGGGFTGVELAAELAEFMRILGWKYQFPLERLEILVIEGASQLLPGLSSELARRVKIRLHDLGVEIRLQNLICQVDDRQVTLNTEEKINYDMLIWTGGVRSVKLPFVHPFQKDPRDRAIVNKYLQLPGSENIFVIGDNALILDKKKRPAPATASQAVYHGGYVAGAIEALVDGRQPDPYKPDFFGYIIPVGGKWSAMYLSDHFMMYGFLPWLAHRYVDFRYFRRIMPVWKAWKMSWLEGSLYGRNN